MLKSTVVFVLFFASVAFAQEGYMGKEFWLTFPQNAKSGENSSTLEFRVLITSDKDVSGVIEEPHMKKSTPFKIHAGGSFFHDADTLNQISENGVSDKAIHIKADNPISVVALSNRKASTDSYMVIPIDKLGSMYVIAGFDELASNNSTTKFQFNTQFDVIAPEDNTNVEYTTPPNGAIPSLHRSAQLSRGQVLHVNSVNGVELFDISGTIVKASKPVAIVSGHTCAQVPKDINFCDMLMEMPPPNSALGTSFIVPKLAKRDAYALRVFATQPNTEVRVSDGSTKIISPGEMYINDNAKSDMHIQTSAPVLVAQYAQSSEADSVRVADPFMLFVPSTDRFINSTIFVVPNIGEKIGKKSEYPPGDVTIQNQLASSSTKYVVIRDSSSILTEPTRGDGWEHWISIVVPRSGITGVKVNAAAVESSLFQNIAGSDYSVALIETYPGVQTITSQTPMAVYSYGYGLGGANYDSYGHLCGQRLDSK